jgi:hypothetical protein
MNETRIEVIAIGKDAMYSAGAIVVSSNGDVYQISKIKGDDFHMSRHASGERHWKSNKRRIFQKMGSGAPIRKFKGIENLGTTGFGLESLPKLFNEYTMGNCNGVFAIDMREYADQPFNLSVWILTAEGFPSLLTLSGLLGKRQMYVYPDCHPMLAMTAGICIGGKGRNKP